MPGDNKTDEKYNPLKILTKYLSAAHRTLSPDCPDVSGIFTGCKKTVLLVKVYNL
jgi:hypothetical protein